MNWFDFFNHIVNLLLPAFGVAVLLTLLAALARREWPLGAFWARLLALDFCVGAVVLVAGLFVAGGDGHMATYGAMVLAVGSCHAWLARR
ncbi:MAG: hypothetical protein QM617_02595 [Comamonas sp.]